MAETVALSEIRVGDKDGNVKVIAAGDKVSKSDVGDDWDNLVESGAIGDPADQLPTLGSTSSNLQSPENISATNVPPGTEPNVEPNVDDEELAKVLDKRTNQVARDENPAVEAKKTAKSEG